MSKPLWLMTEVPTIESTDLIYILRDPVTGRLDRVITAHNLLTSLNFDLDHLSDVVITAPVLNQVLKHNGTNWVNSTVSGAGATILDELGDVAISAVAVGHILRHDGAGFVNVLGTTFFASASHNHDANYQPLDTDLTTIAGLTPTTDNMIQSVGSAWASRTPAQVRTALGLVIGTNVQAFDADLSTLAGLAATTDNFIVSVASAWASRTPAQVRTTLGLVIGTNVQAWSAVLDDLAGLTQAADRLPYFDGASTAALAVFTAAGRALIDDVDAAAQRTTLGLGTFALLSSLNLDGLSDVIITAPSNTQVLKYNGTNWVNAADAGGGGGALDDLTDVIITAPSTGQVVKYNGTNWINDTDATGGGGTVDTVVAGNNIDVDSTDPANPIVSVETLVLADISDVTASTVEVNLLDGVTTSTAELNFVDGVTSDIQTQLNARQPLDTDLTTIAGLTATTDNIIQSVAGAWASRTPAQVKTALALTPGTDIMAFDADLQTIAGLTATTNNFIVGNASAWASRTPAQAIAHLGLDADIATLVLPASTTISAFGATVVDDADGAAVRTTIGAAATSHSHTSLKERDYTVGGTLVASTGVVRLYFKRAVTITNVMAAVDTQPTGASVIVDVNKNGTTIFTTQGNRPTIAVSTNTDLTSVPDVTAFAAGDYATIDIDQIGSTIAGANLTVTIEYTESIT